MNIYLHNRCRWPNFCREEKLETHFDSSIVYTESISILGIFTYNIHNHSTILKVGKINTHNRCIIFALAFLVPKPLVFTYVSMTEQCKSTVSTQRLHIRTVIYISGIFEIFRLMVLNGIHRWKGHQRGVIVNGQFRVLESFKAFIYILLGLTIKRNAMQIILPFIILYYSIFISWKQNY